VRVVCVAECVAACVAACNAVNVNTDSRGTKLSKKKIIMESSWLPVLTLMKGIHIATNFPPLVLGENGEGHLTENGNLALYHEICGRPSYQYR